MPRAPSLSVPVLLRRLAREHTSQFLLLGPVTGRDGKGLLMALWMARLSATLIHGNAAVHMWAGYFSTAARAAEPSSEKFWRSLAHLVPEGDSAYELWVC